MKTEVVSEGKIAFGLIADLASGFCGWELERRFRPVIIRSRLKERSKTWVVQAPREWRQVVYHLLGKLCDRRFLPVLNLGFRTWKDSGPKEMVDLLSELDWLKDPTLKKKIRYLSCHEDFLNRLAVVDYFESIQDPDLELLGRLKNDPHPLVRAVAGGTMNGSLFRICQIYENLLLAAGDFREPEDGEYARFATANLRNFLLPEPRAFWNYPWEMPIR